MVEAASPAVLKEIAGPVLKAGANLVVLSIGAAVLGMILNNSIQHWLAPPTGGHPHDAALWEIPWQGWVTLLVVLVGVAIGYLMYRGEISFEQPHTTNPIVYIGRNDLLADKFEGKRLNSPNDLVYSSDGTLFFTDPPLDRKSVV